MKEFAPRIAYANPTVPFEVERIRDPRTKALDPKGPDVGSTWDEQPEGQLTVTLGESKVVPADDSRRPANDTAG